MSLSTLIAPQIPFLRRYARALRGQQEAGDAFVVATLEALLAEPQDFPHDLGPRVGLYKVFHRIWASTHSDSYEPAASEPGGEASAPRRLGRLTPRSRQALLLTALEGFTVEEAATILDSSEDEINGLIADAIVEIERQDRTKVLIIEDEPIISADLEMIVKGLQHDVIGVARTRTEAVDAARRERPGLVLADIQLADGSSGIDAVTDILSSFDVPVIFITAFPERLLTGERPEPSFLITKPYQDDTVKAAIGQALFFRERVAG
ncbi:Sigma-70, region 4 [Tistlia consotensis]|uniref:Sigma-70, region 4 n=1 Tax=Tistlia consotensis USBA 355 TaxID=560819 RepID=A0A1Y6CJB4_9PROT|nr:response regulator [Tistlia consotensis]SMF57720.1 Sigma-70, region 4 [Tistlia consotensis USBA 355]SNR45829.1 Sigma-70, region 4 [Tistlia consotensis]